MSNEMNISEILAEQVNRLFADRIDRDLHVQAEQGQLNTALWQEVEGLGITRALCNEQQGGADLNWADCEPVIRLTGTYAAPLPLGETLLASWSLSMAGLEIPDGAICVASDVFRLDGQGRLSGHAEAVNWLPQSAHVVLVAIDPKGQTHICLVASPSDSESITGIDRQPCASLTLNGTPPLLTAPSPLNELGLLPHLAVLRSIQIAGALAQVLDLCIEYANTRVQFGRPIGRFQAIQHMIAELAGKTAAAQVAGLYAARQVDQGKAEQGAAIAKSLVSRYATQACTIAHQVFGAIGTTDEHSLHYFTRRLWQWRTEAGSDHWWSERLGQAVLQRPGSQLWEYVTRTQEAVLH